MCVDEFTVNTAGSFACTMQRTVQAAKHVATYLDIREHTAWLVQRLACVTTENRVMFNELMDMKGNIRVIARVRPMVRR